MASIEDLVDNELLLVFDLLDFRQKHGLMRVNRRWKLLIWTLS